MVAFRRSMVTLLLMHAATMLKSCGSKPLQGKWGLFRGQLRGLSIHYERSLIWHSMAFRDLDFNDLALPARISG